MTDTFTSATERHIEVGDGLEMFVIMSKPEGGWEAAIAELGPDAEMLESMGIVGSCETRLCIIRKELKKD